MAINIKPIKNNNSIQLKFQFSGTVYKLGNLGAWVDPIALNHAQLIADTITTDIKLGRFTAQNNQELGAIYNPSTEIRQHADRKAIAREIKQDAIALLDVWDKWVESLNLSSRTANNHYALVRKMIVSCKPSINDSRWFIKASESLSTRTHNDRLQYLKSCLSWAVGEGITNKNPYQAIKSKSINLADIERKEKRKPFTLRATAHVS